MPYNLNIRGWMMERELKIIEQLAKNVPADEIIVEVGSLFGRSSYCWAASNPSTKVICFDRWGGEEEWHHSCDTEGAPTEGDFNTLENFISNTKNLENITPIKVSAPIFPDIGSPFLVFIDLLHYNPCDWDTIMYWLPKIKKNGILCGHDMMSTFPDVIDNVNRLEVMLDQKVTTYDDSSLWSFKL